MNQSRWQSHTAAEMAREVPTAADRFWARVQRGDGCWLWTGARNEFGYGRVSIRSRVYKAHRVAWYLARGPVPDGIDVLHSCDNPPCCNPAHLHLGTHRQNMREMVARNPRFARAKTATGDVTDIYEFQDVVRYLAEDARTLTTYLATALMTQAPGRMTQGPVAEISE